MLTSELIERFNLEVAIMSYIINENPSEIPVEADDFTFDIIKDIFRWWTDYDYVPTRKISVAESKVVDMCINADYASCGPHAFLADCKMIRRTKWS